MAEKAQETLDVELLALAMLVARETVVLQAGVARYGELQFDPSTEAARTLERLLFERDVLPSVR